MEAKHSEYKNKLLKVYNYEKKKIYPILKGMTEEEKEIVLSDKDVLSYINKINNREVLGMIFRMSPSNVQELLWNSEENQKKLLGITTIDEQNLNGYLYFSKQRIRHIQLFIKDVKSSEILCSLSKNYYFQIIMLFSDKIPTSILESINILDLFENTINSGVYDLANNSHKRTWIAYLNMYIEKMLLPKDFRVVFSEPQKTNRGWYNTEANTIIPMLRSKSYHLKEKNRKVEIDKEILKLFNMQELMMIYNLSVERAEEFNLGKDKIEAYIEELTDEHIKNGTVISSGFINFKLISNSFQYFVFKKIVEASVENKRLEEELTNKLFSLLFKEKYSEEEYAKFVRYIRNALFCADKDTLSKLINNPSDKKSIFHMRFNKVSDYMNYLDGIEISQIENLNVKQINKIVKLLEDKTQDEISDIYSKAIRMYLVFGLDRTVAILKGDYGNVSKSFLDCVSKLNISEVELHQVGKKYEPVLNQEFINFLFTGNNICELLKNESVFERTWFYLYNDFFYIKETCRGHITIKQAEIVLREKMNKVKYNVDPNLYKLEEYLYEIGLGNKTKHKNEEIYEEVVKIYKKQLERKVASIPYVSGVASNGYRYEVMRMDDVIAYVLGYRANCCIRTLDIAHNHLLHALLCKNGRILLTYNENGKLNSFSPLKRNGELLIANSIEVIGDKEDKNIAVAFSEGIKAIMENSRNTEKDDYLKVACIGSQAYLKHKGIEWPQNLPTPTILEKNDSVYGRTDEYHRQLDIIMMEDGFDLRNLKFGEITQEYSDPRKSILSCKFSDDAVSLEKIKVDKVVNLVKYCNANEEQRKMFRKVSICYMDYAFFNDDWYILIDKRGNFHYDVVIGNPQALKEMKATLAVISEMTKKKEIEEYYLSFKNNNICI